MTYTITTTSEFETKEEASNYFQALTQSNLKPDRAELYENEPTIERPDGSREINSKLLDLVDSE